MSGSLTLSSWRVLAGALVTPDDLIDCWGKLTQLAKEGDPQALALWCRYTDIGRHIKAAALEASEASIDWSQLETLDGCLCALRDLAAAQERGDIDEKVAAGLRSSVEAAVRVHAAKSGTDAMQALSEAGAIPFFAEAGRELESFREYLDEQKEADDADA